MKKGFLAGTILFLCSVTVMASTLDFNFEPSKLDFNKSSKNSKLTSDFEKKYELSYSNNNKNKELEKQIQNLSKKTTYLLLGKMNNEDESNEEYYKRHGDYKNLASYKYFPKDKNSSSGYDETNELYKYVIAGELAIPQLFNQFNELDIIYNSYGNIKVSFSNNLVISTVTLPKVKMKEADKENNGKYKTVSTNLIITYYYIKIDNEYRLTYLFGETSDKIDKYFNEVESTEKSATLGMVSSYNSNLTSMFNYDKLNAVTKNQIDNIYNKNINNVVYLTGKKVNNVITNANGIFINDGIVVTTWSFISKVLKEGQHITIKDSNNKNYNMDGIITINIKNDIALIKLKEKNNSYVTLSNTSELELENPAIMLSSKSGMGLTIQKGIIISSENDLETTNPVSETDVGSGLFDKNGNLIGVVTSKTINSNISTATNLEALSEIQNKFKNLNFDDVKVISFDKLKENYYYTSYSDESVVNNVSKSKLNHFNKIGDIKNSINLKLVKANYDNNVFSFRYQNEISEFASSMQLASKFISNLVKDGYKEILNGSNKKIYENNKYQIVIMDKFDYLIVVMVKL